jgi:hypothetical protein
VVLEGALVNLDVTSPGATLALALMFLKTGDAAVAAAFAVPDTRFALDFVRPDLVQLRVLARALVLWDDVQPSDAWVQAQLPPLIQARRPGAAPPWCGMFAPCASRPCAQELPQMGQATGGLGRACSPAARSCAGQPDEAAR